MLGPGDVVWLSARFAGYSRKVDEDKDRQSIHLTYRIEAADFAGVPIVEPKTGKIETDLAREDKNWLPKIRQEFLLPPLADSGVYRIKLAVRDEFNQQQAERELRVTVKGHEVEPSDRMVARNIRFYRAENDERPLAEAVYRPGDTVWARFDMTGYKLGAGNSYEISYGLEVFRGSDQRSMYKVEEAAREKDATFYRRRYTPGGLSLNLQKDLAPGEYVILLRLTDVAGGQTAESRHAFRVER